MESWEGLERMAEGYFQWTDSMTPGTDGDGSPFIGVDNLANYFVAMNHAMGSDIYHYDESGHHGAGFGRGYYRKAVSELL